MSSVTGAQWPQLIKETLAGDRAAARILVAELYPVVKGRVARVLWRMRRSADRDVQQEVEDMTQDVFRALFEGGGRMLRAWDLERGLPLPGFVALLGERHAVAILRSDRRNPWTEDPTLEASLDGHPAGGDPEPVVRSRELLEVLLDRLRVAVSPLGLHMFELLYVQERTVEEVMAATSMNADAVYAWRSRLRKAVNRLAAELVTPAPATIPDPDSLEASGER
jgi:DNA-directed RNA polymerase specialized sigma24 family protein